VSCGKTAEPIVIGCGLVWVGPRNYVLGGNRDRLWEGAAAMRPLATGTVASCRLHGAAGDGDSDAAGVSVMTRLSQHWLRHADDEVSRESDCRLVLQTASSMSVSCRYRSLMSLKTVDWTLQWTVAARQATGVSVMTGRGQSTVVAPLQHQHHSNQHQDQSDDDDDSSSSSSSSSSRDFTRASCTRRIITTLTTLSLLSQYYCCCYYHSALCTH